MVINTLERRTKIIFLKEENTIEKFSDPKNQANIIESSISEKIKRSDASSNARLVVYKNFFLSFECNKTL